MSPKRPQRIAVMRYRFIGDTLLTIPFLQALRGLYSDAEIDLLVGKDASSVMAYCPEVTRVIEFEPRTLGFWGAIKRLKSNHYDRVYVLKRSFSSALMAFLAGIPERIGFNTEHRGFLLTQKIPYNEYSHHEAQCFLEHLDLPEMPEVSKLSTPIYLPKETVSSAERFLMPFNGGPRVVLHATSTNPAKCWPLQHFTQLTKHLIEVYEAQIYCLGVTSEREFYESLREQLPASMHENVVNRCGETTLVESMALLQKMDLVVANDSGMVHMAAAMKTPLVAIFGPMSPQQWFPLSEQSIVLAHPNLTCRPCRMTITCNNTFPCLTEITPEHVFKECKTLLTSWSGVKS